jgi:uncharacterized membrane protein
VQRILPQLLQLCVQEKQAMNIKRIFGSILTVLGISALLYSAGLYVNTVGNKHDTKALIVYGVLGLIFFLAGLGLIRTTKDEA